MNKKIFLLYIPMLLVPYVALFRLATIFLSEDIEFFNFIMYSVFDANALYLTGALVLYCFLSAVLSVICFFISILNKYDALSIARISVIIKIMQIPAYLIIFALSVLFTIAIFTIPFVIGLFLIDYFTLLFSGLLVGASVINSVRQGIFKPNDVIWVIILQSVFCVDVVFSIIFYIKLKRATINN